MKKMIALRLIVFMSVLYLSITNIPLNLHFKDTLIMAKTLTIKVEDKSYKYITKDITPCYVTPPHTTINQHATCDFKGKILQDGESITNLMLGGVQQCINGEIVTLYLFD